MKEILEKLTKREGLFKRLEPFSLKKIGSRKRIAVYHGVDMQNRYTLVFHIRRKSRVLQKEIKEWLEIKQAVENHFGYPILRNIAVVEAPLCSKAKASLLEKGWRVVTQ